MKPIVILQARLSSKRLPLKVLMPINKVPIIEIIYKRIKSKNYRTIVATSNDETDDLLCSFLKSKKIPYYRGSLNNVKSRFLNICKNYSDNKLVIRLTADNIFPDKNLINQMIFFFLKNKKKYLYINSLEKKIPYGLSVELFYLKVLREIKKQNKNDIEHVTWSIKKKNNQFPINFSYNYREKASIDTLFDYLLIKCFFEKQKINTNIHWYNLCKDFYKFSKSKQIKQIKKHIYEKKFR